MDGGKKFLGFQELQRDTYRTPLLSFLPVLSRFSLCNKEVSVSMTQVITITVTQAKLWLGAS